MPRAIVMIRTLQKNVHSYAENSIEEELSKMVLSKKFLDKTGVIFEYYLRVFGWPDFIASLYGPNEGLLKQAILYIREKCEGIVTSTIIGTCPEDQYLRVAEFRNKKLEDLLNSFEEKSAEKGGAKAMAEAFALEEAKNYLKWHSTLLKIFDKMVNNSVEGKSYTSGLESDKKLFRTLLSRIFLDKKKDEISGSERDELLGGNA